MSLSFKTFARLNEHQSSPQITMPLQEVIKAGKVTNTVQIMIMAQLLGALKSFQGGEATRYMNEIYLEGGTPASVIQSLRDMPAEHQVNLARELLGHISQEYSITTDAPCGTGGLIQSISNVQK